MEYGGNHDERGGAMIIEFKCPQCGAIMVFDPDSGMLHCESCDYKERIEDATGEPVDEEKVEAVRPYAKDEIPSEREFVHEVSEEDRVDSGTYENEKQYICKSCGAAIIVDEHTSATSCPYCGSTIALGDRLNGEKRPDKVIPFKISKEKAQAAYKKWARNGRFCPPDFLTERRLKDIQGIYVPFFLYDINVKGEADCLCTKVKSYRSGDYIYTRTSHYHVYRRADLEYLKIPTDASVNMDDQTMDMLEPFDYGELTNFDPAYLAGFTAEKYSVEKDQLEKRAYGRSKKYALDYIGKSIEGYSSVTYNKQDVDFSTMKDYYAMLPVWIMGYTYKGEHRVYTMNGQTGKIIGKPPISKGKVALWFFGLFGVALFLFGLILFVLTCL